MNKLSKETLNIITVAAIAIVVLNLINHETKKNFEKSVIEAVKKNPDAFRTALGQGQKPGAPPNEEDQLKDALANKVQIDLGNTPVLGKPDAAIMIVVFSDFQCPFSKRGAETINALKQKYGDKLNFVYKNLPLPFHPEAMPSARAALAASKQGKFYEYHDKLFDNQTQLGEDTYVKIAQELGLNMEKFNTDRNSKEVEDQIKKESEQANSLGFNGTPGFALNGVKILGAYPVEHFEKIISALGLS